METGLVIVALAGISFVWALIKWALKAGVNKGVNAASNAVKRAQEKNNPPQAESLADRYRGSGTND
jgi:hypothetical protein